MGLADDIINGNYQKGSYKPNLANDIISGNYTNKKKKKQIEKESKQIVNNLNPFATMTPTEPKEDKSELPTWAKILNANGSVASRILGDNYSSTVLDAAGAVTQGALSSYEGVSDWGYNELSDKLDQGASVLEFFGGNGDKLRNKANEYRTIASGNDTEDIMKDFQRLFVGDNKMEMSDEELSEKDWVTNKSKLDEVPFARSALQGVGNSLANASMTGYLGGATSGLGNTAQAILGLTPMYMSAAGSGEQEALQGGANRAEARLYGMMTGVIESGSEAMFGGLGKLSKALGFSEGALDDVVIKKITSKINNTLLKNGVDLGLRGVGEGFEEIASGFFGALAKKLTYMKGKDIKKLWEDEQLWDSFISGMLSSIIMQSPTNVMATAQGVEADTGITRNENKVVDAVVEERTQGQELSKKELNQIRQEVREDLQNGYISTDIIERVLGQDYDRSGDRFIQESYNEQARRRNSFNTDLNQYTNESQRKIVQKAIDSGILNDSKKTHNFVDLISKIAADKGMDFEFTNNERIKESGFGVEGKTVNGYVNGNTIGLNIESNNALNETVGHEITHVLEGSDMYQALQDSLKSYVGEAQWNARIKELTETYKNVENADVTKELTADLVGENLFNNEDFVRSLSTKNRNLFQKIFDEIKYLVKVATAGSKEKRELVKLQKVFQEVYRDSKTTKEGTQYSLNDYEKYQNEAKAKLQEIRDTVGDDFANNLENQMNEYKERHPLEYKIREFTKSRDAKNINDEFFKEHSSDYDKNSGTNTPDGRVTVLHLQKGDNLAKVSFTENQDKIWIDELYIKNQKQGYGSEIVNAIKEYANEQGKDVEAFKELSTAKGFWDKTLRSNTKYSLTDNQGRELSKEQQEYFKDSKIRNENGELETVYHTTPNQFTIFDSDRAGENTGYDNTAFGSFVTTNRNFSERFGDINEEGTKGNTMEMYANITNPITHPYNAEYKYSGEELDNIVENWFKAIDETEALDELKSYVEDGDYDNLYQAYRNTVEFSDESPFEYASDEKETLQEKGFDGVEFVEGLDKDVNYNVSDSNEPVSSYAVFNSNQLKNIDNSKPTSNPDIRYSLSVEEANTTQDNEGRKLNDNQLTYFKDSKAVDENGNLVTVYHTMTNTGNQFFEFNPVGTDFYRFGDQVVNYFTDNQDMSGSYADSNYKRAYTKPIKSMEDVQDFIKFQNTQNDSKIGVNGITSHYSIEKNGNGFTLKQTPSGKEFLGYDNLSEEGKVALNRLRANERVQKEFEKSSNPTVVITDTLKGWDIVREYKGYPELAELVELYDRESQKLIATGTTYEEQMVIREILKNDLENYLFGTQEYSDEKVNEVIERSLTKQFENEQDLIDNIQNNFQAKYQYAGYVNMTNPYVIDTFGENWDSVTTERNEAKNSEYNRVIKDNETKEKLYNLAQESERLFKEYSQSNKPREFAEYSIIKNKINNSELREVVNDMGMFGFTYEGWLEAGKQNAELFGEEYKQTLPDSDEKITNYTESLNPAEQELVQDLTIGEFVNRYGELYKENMKFGDSSSYFKDQFRITTGTTLDTDKIGYSNMFDLARYNFDGSSVSEFLDEKLTTNDLVKRIIEKNNSGETNYDGLIMKNVYDYGGKSNKSFKTTGDLYVTFNSNQFKAVDNLNPTDDADIRYQLGNNDIAPTRGWNVRGEDIRLQNTVQETIAPLQEQVQQLQSTIEDLRDNIAPLTEEEANNMPQNWDVERPVRYNLTKQESKRLDFLDRLEKENMLTENLAEERNELMAKENPTPIKEDMTVYESLNDVRDIDEVGKRNVNAYQYDHPEVKPFFREEARKMLADLNNTIKGEKYAIPGQSKNINDWEWVGIKRQTSPEIAALLDGELGTKYSYDDIRKGLNAIIADSGAENIAVAKRIEFLLDNRLRNGYDLWDAVDENYEPYHIEPNQEYLNMLKEQAWDKYYDQIPFETYTFEEEPSIEKPQEIAPTQTPVRQQAPTQQVDALFMPQQQINRELTQPTKRKIEPRKKGIVRQALETLTGGFINRNVLIDDISKRSGNSSIRYKGDMWSNYMSEAERNIKNYQTDINGNVVGEGVNKLFQNAKDAGIPEAVFNEFLIDYSNVDRWRQNKGSQTPYEESTRRLRDYAIKYPQIKKYAKEVWNFGKKSLQNRVDAGLMTQETADYLKKIYPHYVPYISQSDDIGVYYSQLNELKPQSIKRARGGAGAVLPVQEALAKYVTQEKRSIRQNALFNSLIDTFGEGNNFGVDKADYTGMEDSLFMDGGKAYLTAYKDGKQRTTQIDMDLYNELNRTADNQIKDIENRLSLITKPLQGISNLRRNFLTSYNPTFALFKNPVKDVQDAAYYSKHTKDMLKNLPSAYKEMYSENTDLAKQFKSLYGAAEYEGLGKNYAKLSEAIELAPRFAEFKASIENGASLEEALYNARDVTTNFSRGGTITKAMNRNGFTFLNASVQGFDKFVRNFSEQQDAKGYATVLAKTVALSVLPAIFNELAFGSGDDKDEEYEALPDYVKDNYYLFKMPNGEFLRIPKGRALSIFGSAARRTLEYAQGEEDAFDGFFKNAWSQIGPVELGANPLDNTILAPIVQAAQNRAWYGGDIVPSRLQDVPAGEQYDASIDSFSIWLGERTGISPYKINYVLDQYTGGVGDALLPLMTKEATNEGGLLAPIKDQFVVNSTDDNKYVSDFYSKKEEITTIANGKNATDQDALQKKYLDNISLQMSELYKERREIQEDDSLTKKEKYQKVSAIKDEINRLAKEGLDNYQNVELDGDYAEIDGNSYQKGDDGKWKKVKEATSENTQELGLRANEKDTYVKTTDNIKTIKKQYSNSTVRKQKVIGEIRNSNLPKEAKVQLYKENYTDQMVDNYMDMGMDINSYLDYKTQEFTADKDINGKSISGSKKQKVFDYINNMNIPFEQKVMLVKQEYPNYNEYNEDIINYLNNNQNIDYDQERIILENLGFKVDSDGNISW